MRAAHVLFPHQIFEEIVLTPPERLIVLVEHPLYYTQLPFHKQKLVLHRASMRAFADRLRAAGHPVRTIEIDDFSGLDKLAGSLLGQGIESVSVYEPTDDWLEREIVAAFAAPLALTVLPTPMFLTSRAEIDRWFGDHAYRMADFYVYQRRRLGILVDTRGKPEGGKWSFDDENRKRLPRKILIPAIKKPERRGYVSDAIAWVEERFPKNYGTTDAFDYPITHEDARAWLGDFLENRFTLFGDYEDAMARDHDRLFHSVLTPMLNIGILTPAEVLDAALAYAAANGIPLNSLEGFVRQIIGWREFIRAVYVREGRKQRTGNALGFARTMPQAFWTGDTGLVPMDTVIRRVLRTAYCHHIERLMIAGNLMLLCEIAPDAVYSWFMELFIDAYDWVMVPNVYGMSQYADSGLMTTKPYVSGSAYLKRMGDWPAGDWTDIWDGLYWRFVDVHRDIFAENRRVGLAPLSYDRLAPARKALLRTAADGFLGTLPASRCRAYPQPPPEAGRGETG